MSILGAGTNDFANLEGDNELYEIFEDIEVNEAMYLYPRNNTGYEATLIKNNYDEISNTNQLTLNVPNASDYCMFSYGTATNSYNPFLKISSTGFNANATDISWFELSCLDNASSNIQTQINNINTGTGYWGGFWSTTTQTNPTANTINLVSYNNSDASNNNVSYSNSSRIAVSTKGTYLVVASFQLSKSSGSAEEEIYFFLRKNGTNIDATGYKEFIKSVPKILTASWILNLNANDYIEIAWWSSDIHAQLEFIPAGTGTPVYPSSPSALVSVNAIATIGGGGGGTTNPALNYLIYTAGTNDNLTANTSTFTFGKPSLVGAASVCRGNLFFTDINALVSMGSGGRIDALSLDKTSRIYNLTCGGAVSLNTTTITNSLTNASSSINNNLIGICSFGTYGNDNITCFSNFIKRANDQYAIYVKTGDMKLEAGTLEPNNIYFNASNTWNGTILNASVINCVDTYLTNLTTSGSGIVSLNGSTTIGDSNLDSVVINAKIGNNIYGSSIETIGSIFCGSSITTSGGATFRNGSLGEVFIGATESTFFDLNVRQFARFQNDLTIDSTGRLFVRGDSELGFNTLDTIRLRGQVINRGDGYSVYANSTIRANGNFETPNTIYCDCGIAGGINFGYYDLVSFIKQRDQVSYDLASTANGTANSAQSDANDALATAGTALGLATTASVGVVALTASVAVITGTTIPALQGQISGLEGSVGVLESKTSRMLPASSTGTKCSGSVYVYTIENPITPSIDLNPYTTSNFSAGLSVAGNINTNDITCDEIGSNKIVNSGNIQTASLTTTDISSNNIVNTSSIETNTLKVGTLSSIFTSTKLDITYGVDTGAISSTSIVNSGNLQTGTLNTGSITATTGTHSIDGSSISLGSYSTPVYINSLLYVPFNPISFLNQWV
jgi:hypothetical protein